MVHTFQQLDGNADIGQILAPHVLDQFRIMTTFNPNARLPGNPSHALLGRDRPRIRQRTAPQSGERRSFLSGSDLRREGNNRLTFQPKPAS